ncbi:MAG: SemiSWEET family transporter [Flavobacteriaceae bacterium]|nr:SemiSWEET family transporter [Flavobacteriaceae bacterium]
MSSIYIEAIGLSAGFLTMIGFFPQLIKIWRSGSTEGVSLVMYFVLLLGVTLWLIYGFFINSLSIIISNLIAGIIQIFIISIIIINRKKEK